MTFDEIGNLMDETREVAHLLSAAVELNDSDKGDEASTVIDIARAKADELLERLGDLQLATMKAEPAQVVAHKTARRKRAK